MELLAGNIRYLRKRKGLTQQELADGLQVKRSLVGAWEEARAVPRLFVLRQLAFFFGLTIDQLISRSFPKDGLPVREQGRRSPSPLRVLPVVVSRDNEELIPIVPAKASAGYLNGYADPEYIGNLPFFSMPVPELRNEKTRRIFQIRGDSMLPIPPGAYVIAEYVEQVSDVLNGEVCVLITREEGLVCKRICFQSDNRLMLNSDNPEYAPYGIDARTLLEIWKVKGVISFELPPFRGLKY